MYFPRENGTFNLIEDGVLPFSTLSVEGRTLDLTTRHGSSTIPRNTTSPPSSITQSVGSNITSFPSTPVSSHGNSATFRSVIARRPPASFNLKLVQARLTKSGQRMQFHATKQTFVELTESTASTEFVKAIARQRWGTDYELVTQDGLTIDNSPATQGIYVCAALICCYIERVFVGLAFWKAPRRKIYAVLQTDIEADEYSSDEDVVEAPPQKKIRKFF